MEQQDRRIRHARANRKDPTRASGLLWSRLRASQLGVRFRREDPIGPYVVDFSCRPHWLTIETDGATHIDPERDCARDAWFIRHGWFVLRFADDEITGTLDDVIEMIFAALQDPAETMKLLNDGKPHRWCAGKHD